MSSNFSLDIISDSKSSFTKAMEILFEEAPGKTAEGYKVLVAKVPNKMNEKRPPYEVNKLAFYWTVSDRKDIVAFPFKMKVAQAVDFAWSWLQETPCAFPEPDHDGDNKKGFRIRIDDEHGQYAPHDSDFIRICLITPEWSEYGK